MSDERSEFDRGLILYRKGERQAAALQFRRAFELARSVQNEMVAFTSLVWESVAHGETERALAVALEALQFEQQCEIANLRDEDRWVLRTQMYSVPLARPVSLTDCQARLAAHEAEGARMNRPLADTLIDAANLAADQGQWESQLRFIEKAFAAYDPVGGHSAIHGSAARAVDTSLRLGRFSAARDWLEAIEVPVERERYGYGPAIDAKTRCAQLEIAIAERKPVDRLLKLVEPIAAIPNSVETGLGDRLRLRIRIALLNPAYGDPLDPGHPVHTCLRHMKRDTGPREAYHNRLTLSDLRLAAVRFAAAIPPVDNTYHDQSEVASVAPTRWEETHRRGRRAELCLDGAMHRARHLDAIFECNFRTLEVQRRMAALAAIQRACR